jgi:hypothetical protein
VPTDPGVLTLAAALSRAVEACDPEGRDDRLADLLEHFEDRDEPITAVPLIRQELDEATGAIDPEGEDPALAVAEAVVLYLARRPDQVDTDDRRLLRSAVDSVFEGDAPEGVEEWLGG